MTNNIDHLFAGMSTSGSTLRLVDRLSIDRSYEGNEFPTLTSVFDIAPKANQYFHVQRCAVSVGGTLSDTVEKAFSVLTGKEAEFVIASASATDANVNIHTELKDMWISERLVVQLQASTPLNAYSNLSVEVLVYER